MLHGKWGVLFVTGTLYGIVNAVENEKKKARWLEYVYILA